MHGGEERVEGGFKEAGGLTRAFGRILNYLVVREDKTGGGNGIRTHDSDFSEYPLSRRAHSATMRSLRPPVGIGIVAQSNWILRVKTRSFRASRGF